MTVSQLIERLGTFDPNLKVVMPCEVEDWCVVGSAYLDLFRFRDDGFVHIADEREPAYEQAVRLFGPEDRP